MSVQTIRLNTSGSAQAGAVSRIRLVSQSVTGPAGADGGGALTTKGDLSTYSTVATRLPVGTNGQILSADSAQTTGLRWIAASGTGDLLAANNLSDVASAATARTNLGLAIGTNVQAYSAVLGATTASFTTADETKLDGIEALADVTDTANVTAAGALMDSEVDADIKTLALPANTTISTFGASLVDDATAGDARTTLGLGTAATTAATAYATAAQGATADTAVQPARSIATTAPLAGGGDLSVNRTLTVSASSSTATGVVELATDAEALTGTDTARAVTPANVAYVLARQAEFMTVAVGDETTAITTGTAKVSFRAPFAFTLTAVRATLATASSSGIPTFDINEAGVSLLSTKLTIDANELTSTTAATAAVISDSAIADDALLTIDIDVAGTGAAGAKVTLFFTRNP